jgi:hypothetical protein
MNRAIIVVMGIAVITALSGAASAGTGKWCFQWDVSYYDQDADADHNTVWIDDNLVDVPARYTYVIITGPSSCDEYFLDSSGCTPSVTINSYTTYHFHQYTYAKKSNRRVYVMPDGEAWGSTVTDFYEWSYGTAFTIPPSKKFDPPPLNNERRVMPAITTLMYQSSLLGWDDGTTHWVSTDVTPHAPHTDKGCGTRAWEADPDHPEDLDYHVCISDHSTHSRFPIAHEFGHTLTWINDGPRDGEYDGSEGYFRASGDGDRCNCDGVEDGDFSHCPTSREFTGSGQKEGFSHFVGAAAYNSTYNTVPANSAGVFFFYKDLMEALETHYDDFTDIFEDPGYDRGNTSDHPFPTTVNTSSDVKWTNNECNPTSGFTHYGNEWDWLDFYWNVWTYGDKLTSSQIMNVWDNVPDGDIAYECCTVSGGTPVACSPRNMPYVCGYYPYNPYPTQFVVGKLWEADDDYDVTYGVKEKAYAVYPDQGENFEDQGDAAGVNH